MNLYRTCILNRLAAVAKLWEHVGQMCMYWLHTGQKLPPHHRIYHGPLALPSSPTEQRVSTGHAFDECVSDATVICSNAIKARENVDSPQTHL